MGIWTGGVMGGWGGGGGGCYGGRPMGGPAGDGVRWVGVLMLMEKMRWGEV